MREIKATDADSFPHVPESQLIPVEKRGVDCIKEVTMPEGERFESTTQNAMPDVVIYERSRECSLERHARFRAVVNPTYEVMRA
jgi:hypothetical protein